MCIRDRVLSLSKIKPEQNIIEGDPKEIWARIADQLMKELPQVNFDMWIKPIIPISINQNVLSLSVKSPFALKMLTERMSSLITRISCELNDNNLELSFVVASSSKQLLKMPNLKNNLSLIHI